MGKLYIFNTTHNLKTKSHLEKISPLHIFNFLILYEVRTRDTLEKLKRLVTSSFCLKTLWSEYYNSTITLGGRDDVIYIASFFQGLLLVKDSAVYHI